MSRLSKIKYYTGLTMLTVATVASLYFIGKSSYDIITECTNA